MVVNSRHWMLHNYSSNCWGTGQGFMLFAVEYHLGIRRSWWQWEHSVLFLDIVRLGNLSEQVLHSLNSRETSLEWKFNVLDSTAFCWNNGVAMLMSLLSCWVSLMASNRACFCLGFHSVFSVVGPVWRPPIEPASLLGFHYLFYVVGPVWGHPSEPVWPRGVHFVC